MVHGPIIKKLQTGTSRFVLVAMYNVCRVYMVHADLTEYVTSGCSSRVYSWLPNYRYLNQSLLVWTKVGESHHIISYKIMLISDNMIIIIIWLLHNLVEPSFDL